MSDRYGRLRVMSVTVCGMLIKSVSPPYFYRHSSYIVNLLFTSVTSISSSCITLSTGYQETTGSSSSVPSLTACSEVGLLQCGSGPCPDPKPGYTTGVAASHAYTADCTHPAARARVFSLSLGLLFIGMALGPTLGSLLIAGTGSAVSVFYAATACHICYSCLIWFVLPESLTRSAMMKSRRRHAIRLEEEEQKRKEREARGGATGSPRLGKSVIRASRRILKRAFAFMSPLSVFAPVRDEASEKTGKSDWSLTSIAAGFGFYTLVVVSSFFCPCW